MIHDNYEIISFKLHLKSSKSPNVFIRAYNSPSADADAFLDYLDTLVHSLNPVDDIFLLVISKWTDLKMDEQPSTPMSHFSSKKNQALLFCDWNGFRFVLQSTR